MPAPCLVYLETDPKTPLSVSFTAGSSSAPLVVILTGLARPASSWDASVTHLLDLVASVKSSPGIITWDRYGQGLSGKQDHMHDANDVVETLRELLAQLLKDDLDRRKLRFVGK